MSLCFSCMKEKGDATVCSHCGFDEAMINSSDNNFLCPGTVLHDRYIVGVALGQGGFGITYIGYDKILNTRVAIKEYFPSGMVGRGNTGNGITIFTQTIADFNKGLERFLQEARTLARFADHPCIVGVKDCFEENDTAYMIMEHLDGISLKEYLKRKGNKLPYNEAISILTPVMDALSAVHQEGIIHRDVSPDNIFITQDSRVRLIDFGAARQALGGEKSLSIMLKPGYAPEEQYRTHGNQGPWTDVYALTATLYRMIVGKVPQDSLERVLEDTLEIPTDLPMNVRNAIQIGMAVRANERYTSIDQLKNALFNSTVTDDKSVTNPTGKINQSIPLQTNNKAPLNKTRIAIVAISSVIALCLIAIVAILCFNNLSTNEDESNLVPSNTNTVSEIIPTATPEPTPEPVHTYQVVVAHVTWWTAKEQAETLGGHLVTINSQEEFDQVTQMVSSQYPGVRNVWVGAMAPEGYNTPSAASAYWGSNAATWITGEPFTFAKWRHGEPSGCDGPAPERYIQIFSPKADGYAWSFNDAGDNLSEYRPGTLAYVVEYEG